MTKPEITVNLKCAACRWENKIDLEKIGVGLTVEVCEEHGHHSSIIMTVECPQCKEINDLIIET